MNRISEEQMNAELTVFTRQVYFIDGDDVEQVVHDGTVIMVVKDNKAYAISIGYIKELLGQI